MMKRALVVIDVTPDTGPAARFAGVATTREWITALADGIELSPVGCLDAAT